MTGTGAAIAARGAPRERRLLVLVVEIGDGLLEAAFEFVGGWAGPDAVLPRF